MKSSIVTFNLYAYLTRLFWQPSTWPTPSWFTTTADWTPWIIAAPHARTWCHGWYHRRSFAAYESPHQIRDCQNVWEGSWEKVLGLEFDSKGFCRKDWGRKNGDTDQMHRPTEIQRFCAWRCLGRSPQVYPTFRGQVRFWWFATAAWPKTSRQQVQAGGHSTGWRKSWEGELHTTMCEGLETKLDGVWDLYGF